MNLKNQDFLEKNSKNKKIIRINAITLWPKWINSNASSNLGKNLELQPGHLSHESDAPYLEVNAPIQAATKVKKPIKNGLFNLKILLSIELFLLLDLINVIDINNK